MTNRLLTLALMAFLAGCGSSNPFMDDGTGDGDTDGDTTTDSTLPPGTTNPTPGGAILRSEPRQDANGDHYGDGFANNISYNATSDTFYVDGLAFDGSQPEGVPYGRSVPGNLGSYALYEAPLTHPDFITSNPINQFPHRALYGVSSTGNTEFAIVRTGAYMDFGFGGFIYQRSGGVTLPTQGQAHYAGDYAGIRDFSGSGGLEYITGDMEVDIDFDAFPDNCAGAGCNAVHGYVFNRQIYDTDGNNITGAYLTALNANLPSGSPPATEVPAILFRIGPGVMDSNGEITGDAYTVGPDGQQLDEGNYYLLMSGNHTAGTGGEIVGVIVVEGADPRVDDVQVRETGGFILPRQ